MTVLESSGEEDNVTIEDDKTKICLFKPKNVNDDKNVIEISDDDHEEDNKSGIKLFKGRISTQECIVLSD